MMADESMLCKPGFYHYDSMSPSGGIAANISGKKHKQRFLNNPKSVTPAKLQIDSKTESFRLFPRGWLCQRVGEKFVVLPGQLHIHPWNAGYTELVYRQSDKFEQPSSEAVQDVLGVFATRAGLAREGKVDESGRPKNLMQLAVTLRTLNKYGGFDTRAELSRRDLGQARRMVRLQGGLSAIRKRRIEPSPEYGLLTQLTHELKSNNQLASVSCYFLTALKVPWFAIPS